MMRPLIELVVLFFSLSQAQFHNFPMWLSCTTEYFMVMIDRDFFRNGIILQPDDVILGDGCSVTSVVPNRLYMVYGLGECGMDIEVTPDVTYIHSAVYIFRQDLRGDVLIIPVTCRVSGENSDKLISFCPSPDVLDEYNYWKSLPPQLPTSWANEHFGFML